MNAHRKRGDGASKSATSEPSLPAVNRREFHKLLSLASLLALATAGSGATRRLFSSIDNSPAALRVADVEELAVGGYKLFRYPTEEDPCILIRLAQDQYVAFSQSCTHLKCPVHFQSEKRQLVCPCHEGYFSAENGRPLAGPPKRPLPQLQIELKDGQIWVQLPNQAL
jgi:arsenite oxidase small subunit